VPEGVEDQVELAIENLDRVLGKAGGSLDTVIRTTVYLVDASDFKSMNKIYAARFAAPYPARSTVVVAALALPELKFEIEAIAIRRPGTADNGRRVKAGADRAGKPS
jgi:2-iminobutanoate/2-iminopropanoate deaminase